MTDENKTLILADWGNSSGRLFCVRGDSLTPEILAQARIPGAKDIEDCALTFSEIAKDWMKRFNVKEAIFTGAVTSNIGWLTTEYALVPAQMSDVQVKSLTTEYGLLCTFVSGTSITEGPLGYFDTVRGEDIQAFGWMALTGLTEGILCTPGTHTKWLTVKNGAITSILTGVTGESFEVFNTHSMLTRGAETASHDTPEFERGLDAMIQIPRPALTQMLISIRTLQLSGDITPARSADYLSGLLTGEDCAAAHACLPNGPIHMIGDAHAVDRYAAALRRLNRNVEIHDGQACVIAGLQAVHRAYPHRH